VIGLGYVGLPLALSLAKQHHVVGFDISETRVSEMRDGRDSTEEVGLEDLSDSSIVFTNALSDISAFDVYIVTVPTPVDEANQPDLTAVVAASDMIGQVMAKGALVVFESTVYPGVTEDICGPAMEHASGLSCGSDFFLGYSPERINPGDREHTVEKITKVVAAQTPEHAQVLSDLYGAMNGGNIFVAKDIKTAEAAKVIENAQRDINIAFVNEVAMIFSKAGLSTHDVLEVARTKWNFLDFKPGLVGGHCIGVDPYYLAEMAEKFGHKPEVILSGRRINDEMSAFLARHIHAELGTEPSDILVLGLTFKENVPDLRNSKAADLIQALTAFDHRVTVHDPKVDPIVAKELYGIDVLDEMTFDHRFDAVVCAVSHADYRRFTSDTIRDLLNDTGIVIDIKGIWRDMSLGADIRRWTL
jgi:UDP-N-acetyl-D-galactosamine dehydrogenase